MERRVDVVRSGPRLVDGRVSAEHVVIGEDVGEAKLLHALSVSADGAAVGPDLGLREYHAYIHDCLFTTAGLSAQRRRCSGARASPALTHATGWAHENRCHRHC